MVSDEKKAEIAKEAKEILDRFGKALKEVKVSDKRAGSELEGYREESDILVMENGFRERILENAPEKTKDSIIAERKKW